MKYTHLQVRSGYSLMNSSITINKLVDKAKKLGFTSLALTDEQVMHGAVSFYQTCHKAGIKPILGMVTEMSDEKYGKESCILLAKNNNGYKNLLKISSRLQLTEENQIEKDDLLNNISDLIVIVSIDQSSIQSLVLDNKSDEMQEYINHWKNWVNEQDFYLGLAPIKQNNQQLKIIKREYRNWSVKVTAISDVRYIDAKDQAAYQCLQAMRKGNKWLIEDYDKNQVEMHLRSMDEVINDVGDLWPELLNETDKIAQACNVDLNFDQRMLPSFPVPNGDTPENYLKKLCEENVSVKYSEKSQVVMNRLNYELNVIQSMQFSDYFLIVWDFVQFAKSKGIMVGPGRGSAAGSLVAYLLGITDVDPIRYDLLFERFLNPERITMPDIDIDFSDNRRDEIIHYVKEKYGPDHVAQIITFGTFAARSLLRELIKTMEIDQQDANFILKEIPVNTSKSIADSVRASKELTDYIKQSPKLQALFRIATKLEGLPRHISTHAAGVVISKEPLVEHVPLIDSQGDIHLTQYAMKELEAIGLLKMDFLGLRNLTLMEKIISSVKRHTGKTIDLDGISLDNNKTFSLLREGKTNGVFQLESKGMQQVLANLKPTHFEDVVAVNALYRPGPMEFIPDYIKRKTNQMSITYPHEDLKPILEKTFGVLVYQEQIMQIANKMAGFSLGQADILRRAVSKKQRHVMEEEKSKFIEGCIENGYSQKVAEEVYDWIVRFSNYGFNRSHAVAYSVISYQLAYLKANYTPHFLAEVLSSVVGQQEKIRLYVKELREFDINLLPPSINRSFGRFTVENGKVRMGLLAIKGIGNQVIKEIIRVRKEAPFKNLFDFCLRVPLKIVTRQVIESLILSGAFDETYSNRASLLATIDQAIEQGDLFKEFEDQPTLFQNDLELDESYIEIEPFTKMKELSYEKELMGIYLSSHPLSSYRNKLRSNGYLNLSEVKSFIGKNVVKSSAVIQEIKTIRTKRGDPMAFITLGDEVAEIDAVVFPDLYRTIHRSMVQEELVLLKGKVEQRNGREQIIISELIPFKENLLTVEDSRKLFVKIVKDNERDIIDKLKLIAKKFPGPSPIIIYHQVTKRTYQLAVDYNLDLSKACLNELNQVFGKDHIAIK